MASGAGFAARVDKLAVLGYYSPPWMEAGLGFHAIAGALFLANVLTLAFVWGCVQFHRHDYKAPWLAYAAFLMPLLYLAGSVIVTEGLPPQFDALALRQ